MPYVAGQLFLDVNDELLRRGVECADLDDGNREDVVDLKRNESV